MKWKRFLSTFLICVLFTVSYVPKVQANANNTFIGANGTIYDVNYDPIISDEDAGYYDENDEEYRDYLRDYKGILASDSNAALATDSNWELATDSNWELATDSNWELATGSNAVMNIADYTTPGPLLPAVGGMRRARRMALYAAEEGPKGIHTSKSVTANDDGSYKIRLESFVEGNITTSTTAKPVDIVLVLDVSGSMEDCIKCGDKKNCYDEVGLAKDFKPVDDKQYYYSSERKYEEAYYCAGNFLNPHTAGWYTKENCIRHSQNNRLTDSTKIYTKGVCVKRIDALKSAVTAFIDQVQNNAIENNVDHRISIVKFAGKNPEGDQNKVGDDFYYEGRFKWNYSQIVKNLTDVKAGASGLKNAVNGLIPAGATMSNHGMERAASVLKGIPSERNSQKAVIMFTDGEPSSYSDFDSDVADAAISQSKTIKEMGATVYTIGVFDGADPDADIEESTVNRYMHYVSSNYKNATSLNKGGTSTKPETGSYYMSASSAESLEEIFSNIGDQIQGGGASIELGKEAVVKDIVTPYFSLPDEVSDIKTYVDDCTGKSGDNYTFKENPTEKNYEVNVDQKNNTVSVSGFDYNHNFVADQGRVEGDLSAHGDFKGRKLIIEFNVKPREGFLGGNGVPTNGAESGLYGKTEDGTEVSKLFEVPHANVPIKEITVTPEDKNVYLTGGLNSEEMKNGAQAEVGSVVLDLSKENFGLESWQNKFVTITVGGQADGLSNLKSDTTYDMTVTVTPKLNGDDYPGTQAVKMFGSGQGNVSVFKPTVYFTDGEAYYGDSAPALDTLKSQYAEGKTVWKHGETLSTNVEMTGTAPSLSFGFEYYDKAMVSGGTINTKEDVPVTVNAAYANGATDNLIEYVTSLREKCSDQEAELEGKGTFVLHIKTCDLEIRKEGGEPDESYTFKVMKDNIPYTYVNVKGGESVTLKELPVGKYSLEEDTGWSWRYESTITDPVNLSKDNPSDQISCTNKKTNDRWLNVYATVKNIFGITDSTKKERAVR